MAGKILAIVPAYNEQENIAGVINEIKADVPGCDIIVINDRSRDNTSMTAKANNAIVADLPCNLGIGGAVQTGFIYAVRNGYDYAVQVDGDGQHIAAEINKLMDKLISDDCDAVIGSRFLDTKSFRTTAARRLGINVFRVMLRILIGVKITDATSGFRLYNRRAFEYLSDHYPDDYPEPEAIVMLSKKGYKICETGVEMRERQNGSSSITALRSVYYMIKVVMSTFITYLRSER